MDINPKFYSIGEEKRKRIINSGLKAFSEAPYRKVSLAEIAVKAEISKGLIIHYFYNKFNLYKYLFNEAFKKNLEYINSINFEESFDIFDHIADMNHYKTDFMNEYPLFTKFISRTYLDEDENIKSLFNEEYLKIYGEILNEILQKMDRSKFRDFITAEEAYKIIEWTFKGFMEDKHKVNDMDFNKMIDEVLELTKQLKQLMYKEEYH